jgi:hypothetical protein
VAISRSGEVYCWGSNLYGQSDPPAGIGPLRAIAAGDSFSAALTQEGQVICWGLSDSPATRVPLGLSAVTAIDATVGQLVATRATPTGDFDLDAVVSGSDLTTLLVEWSTGSSLQADLNSDGVVDAADLSLLLARWGPVP